jgi:hypothetical protein
MKGTPMKTSSSEAGWRMVFSFLTSRLATLGAAAALALIATPGAKANVIETFHLSGHVGTTFGSKLAFAGTMELDFSDDFTSYTPESLEIRVGGRSLFTTISSVAFGAGVGSLYASNSTRDTLALTFDADSWIGFDQATIVNGQLVFGTLNQFLFGASGTVSRVSGPPIIDPPPPVIDPPVPVSSAAVPELSTWAMMLIGLAGLGFAARRRGRLGLPGERA